MNGHPTIPLRLVDDNGTPLALFDLATTPALTADPGAMRAALDTACTAFADAWDKATQDAPATPAPTAHGDATPTRRDATTPAGTHGAGTTHPAPTPHAHTTKRPR